MRYIEIFFVGHEQLSELVAPCGCGYAVVTLPDYRYCGASLARLRNVVVTIIVVIAVVIVIVVMVIIVITIVVTVIVVTVIVVTMEVDEKSLKLLVSQ